MVTYHYNKPGSHPQMRKVVYSFQDDLGVGRGNVRLGVVCEQQIRIAVCVQSLSGDSNLAWRNGGPWVIHFTNRFMLCRGMDDP